MPFITPRAASNLISEQVHKDYDKLEYGFHGWFTSYFISASVAGPAHDILVDQLHMTRAGITSGNAD